MFIKRIKQKGVKSSLRFRQSEVKMTGSHIPTDADIYCVFKGALRNPVNTWDNTDMLCVLKDV